MARGQPGGPDAEFARALPTTPLPSPTRGAAPAPGFGDADALLARALRGPAPWPDSADPGRMAERALYHGLAGLLAGRLPGWPPELAETLRRRATAQAIWELRHRRTLSDLLAAFAAAGLRVLVLKGSALAYDLYDPPAARSRGDTDLLIAPADLAAAREVLTAQGFAHFYDDPTADEAVRLQEAWQKTTPDGLVHEIDLHWQALNAPALSHLLAFDEAWARAIPLPRLCPEARGLSRDLALLLACAHRAQHIVNPYYVDGAVHYGGDRLIWLRDIDLLARALDADGWVAFTDAAIADGLAPVALDGLGDAAALLGTPLPEEVTARLASAPRDGAEARYLLDSRRAGRAWSDLRARSGLGARLAFLMGRLLPPAAFMRAKYPEHAHRPLPLLHLRRIAGFLTPRGRRT